MHPDRRRAGRRIRKQRRRWNALNARWNDVIRAAALAAIQITAFADSIRIAAEAERTLASLTPAQRADAVELYRVTPLTLAQAAKRVTTGDRDNTPADDCDCPADHTLENS